MKASYHVIAWNNLSDAQKQKVRETFFWIKDSKPEGEYEPWLKVHGFYFDQFNQLKTFDVVELGKPA